eukprot:530089_1
MERLNTEQNEIKEALLSQSISMQSIKKTINQNILPTKQILTSLRSEIISLKNDTISQKTTNDTLQNASQSTVTVPHSPIILLTNNKPTQKPTQNTQMLPHSPIKHTTPKNNICESFSTCNPSLKSTHTSATSTTISSHALIKAPLENNKYHASPQIFSNNMSDINNNASNKCTVSKSIVKSSTVTTDPANAPITAQTFSVSSDEYFPTYNQTTSTLNKQSPTNSCESFPTPYQPSKQTQTSATSTTFPPDPSTKCPIPQTFTVSCENVANNNNNNNNILSENYPPSKPTQTSCVLPTLPTSPKNINEQYFSTYTATTPTLSYTSK